MQTWVNLEVLVAEFRHMPEAYQELLRIYPEGHENEFFRFILPLSDPGVVASLNHLVQLGFHACTYPTQPFDFFLIYGREYDGADLEEAAYLHPWTTTILGEWVDRDPDGIIEYHLNPEITDPGSLSIGGFMDRCLGVSTPVKERMEAARLRHVQFRPTRSAVTYDDNGPTAFRHDVELWELTSDLFLPPLSPGTKFNDGIGSDPFDGNYENGCMILENGPIGDSVYANPEYHYQASAMDGVPPFDLALTPERLGRIGYNDHQLVASQEFYRFCKEHQLELNWLPVRIDPD